MSHSTDLSSPETAGVVSTEVNIAPRSKRYTAAFKARIIQEADACHAPGELGALLRREGIFFSTLSDFRKQKARDDRKDKRNPTSPKEEVSPQVVKELAASEREIRRLRRELECATALLELQKKYPTCWDWRWFPGNKRTDTRGDAGRGISPVGDCKGV